MSWIIEVIARTTLLLLALATATGQVNGADRQPTRELEPPIYTFRLDGQLSLDATGAVVDFAPLREVPGVPATQVRALVKAERFEPVKQSGIPTAARIRARVTLSTPSLREGHLRPSIDDINFPEARVPGDGVVDMEVIDSLQAEYPLDAQYLGADATVLVAVRVGLDGRIADATVRQSSLIGKKGKTSQVLDVIRLFEASALAATRTARVDVKVIPGAKPSASDLSSVMGFRYRIEGGGYEQPASWVHEIRTPVRPVPWLSPAEAAELETITGLEADGDQKSRDEPVTRRVPRPG